MNKHELEITARLIDQHPRRPQPAALVCSDYIPDGETCEDGGECRWCVHDAYAHIDAQRTRGTL